MHVVYFYRQNTHLQSLQEILIALLRVTLRIGIYNTSGSADVVHTYGPRDT